MRIYLVRHGIAEERTASGVDEDRRLTAKGKARLSRVGRGLRRLGVCPAVLLTSPVRRAEDSARLLARVLGVRLVEVLPVLSPGGAPAEILEAMGEYRGRGDLMLVGHEPTLGELATRLISGPAAQPNMPFRKGAVAAFDAPAAGPGARARLVFFLPPRVSCRLAVVKR